MGKKTDRKKTPRATAKSPSRVDEIAGMRIIGGHFRGRKLQYSGDIRTRPMKDRLREAVFNLLGPEIRETRALDLFAGTGALALEAISRGAARATLFEQHYPTAAIIQQNIKTLDLQQQAEIVVGNVFIQAKKSVEHFRNDSSPWLVFCSPPYEFFASRTDEMLNLIADMIESAPPSSTFVVEADQRFDFQTLPDPQAWNVRSYPPAVVGIYRKKAP